MFTILRVNILDKIIADLVPCIFIEKFQQN